MSLRLIKPGVGSANLAGKAYPRKHSLAGQDIEPVGYLKDGTPVWPIMGGSEDEDDPDFTGEGGSEDDEDDEDEEEDKKPPRKGKHSKDDDEDEDDEEDEKPPTRPERQAARYRTQLRAEQKKNADMAARLKALEDKDKKPDEIAERDKAEALDKANKLTDKLKAQSLELAFFKANKISWVDPADALRLVDLDDVEVDEDGTVDAKALGAALRDLAKRKPHLVKKAESSDDSDDEEPGSRRSAPRMNGRRKGTGKVPTREDLAKKFPVLGR